QEVEGRRGCKPSGSRWGLTKSEFSRIDRQVGPGTPGPYVSIVFRQFRSNDADVEPEDQSPGSALSCSRGVFRCHGNARVAFVLTAAYSPDPAAGAASAVVAICRSPGDRHPDHVSFVCHEVSHWRYQSIVGLFATGAVLRDGRPPRCYLFLRPVELPVLRL